MIKNQRKLTKLNSHDEKISELCKKAKELEDSGEYSSATLAMGEWWQGVGVRPVLDNLSPGQKAAVLSRIGALSGWMGSMQQISRSQEMAKDLISEAANLFESIDDMQNWAETRSDLAICYWREGAFDEARVILEDILERHFTLPPWLHGKILLRWVNVEISTRHYEKALSLIVEATPLVKKARNDLLLGKFHFHQGLILRIMGEEADDRQHLNSAIENYQRSLLYYKKAKHVHFTANTENNIGNVYRLLGDFQKANLYFDKAGRTYNKLKDRARVALVFGNKARALVAQSDLPNAEVASRIAVDMLRKIDEKAGMAEALIDLGIILSRRGFYGDAFDAFTEAKEIALALRNPEIAGNALLTLMEELQFELSLPVFQKLYLEADELLKHSPRTSVFDRLLKTTRQHIELIGDSYEENSGSSEKVRKIIQQTIIENKSALSEREMEIVFITVKSTLINVKGLLTELGIVPHLINTEKKASLSQGVFLKTNAKTRKYEEFKKNLNDCYPGQRDFGIYEKLCQQALEYIFEERLEFTGYQVPTQDRTQRRDLMFKNLRRSDFFRHISHYYGAFFIVFDCKNSDRLLDKISIDSISKYSNKAIGNFLILVSRKGIGERARETQKRLFKDKEIVVLSINDLDLLEMISRKEAGRNPEDLLDGLLDKLRLGY